MMLFAYIRRTFIYFYSSYFKQRMRWLRSIIPVTSLSMLRGARTLAAFPQLELFRIYPVQSVVPEGLERDGDSFRKND
ncbi:exported hypothetical protein [Klebsiella variicola]|nr:exported hypothetical protein [Klebsiella variicola]